MIVAFIRVSTDEQAKSGLGLADQKKTIVETAARLRIAIRVVVVDAGTTAGADVDKRPKLVYAIGLLRKGDILLVAKRDRLSRGDPEAMAQIERLVKQKGARIISAAGEGTWRTGSSAVLERRIHDAFAEVERLRIGERTSGALKMKRSRGELAGTVPYGWRAQVDPAVPLTKRGRPGRRLVSVPAEQAAISFMKVARSKGFSLRAIAAELRRRGYRPRGRRWYAETVRLILHEDKKPAEDVNL